MGIWPFGKNKKDNADTEDSQQNAGEPTAAEPDSASAASDNAAATGNAAAPAADVSDTTADAVAAHDETDATAPQVVSKPHDSVDGAAGPFDGDSVDIDSFDFSDFSVGVLDLSSMKINLPEDSQVQVEMGEPWPKMLHIVTRFGRITPVAFAAPRSQSQWSEAGQELIEGMSNDGLTTRLEDGPWGSEVVGENDNGQIRIIGIDGPRWMLRFTMAAPKGREDKLAQLAREVAARTFVYRGNDPVLAGNALQVVMPPQLVSQLQDAMRQRKEQAKNPQPANTAEAGKPRTEAEEEARQHLRDLGGSDSTSANGEAETGKEN